MVFVCDGDGVHALCVGPDDGVGLQAEHDGLGDGADDGHGPGNHQQPAGAVDRGPVWDWEHYRTESEETYIKFWLKLAQKYNTNIQILIEAQLSTT